MAEVAVATRTNGRNLSPYAALHHGELRVLVTPELARMAPVLRVSSRRWVTKGFHVEFPGAAGSCAR